MKSNFFEKNVLITGGLGFVGSNLAINLVDQGAIVTILDSLAMEFGGNLFNIDSVKDKVSVNISDMRDSQSLNALVREKDFIFHLAGQVSHSDSMRNPKMDLEVNCISTVNLLEACRKFNSGARIIYTSTRQVYGNPIELPVTEKHPVMPIDVNGINKISAENYHLLYNKVYSIKTCILRLTNTYGPGMRIKDAKQNFIGVWFKNILNDRARASFDGTVVVNKGAQLTNSDQLINNLMLSDEGHADCKPNLMIFADDVKCAHGATVGQLDDDQLFYLKTRGLSEPIAKEILTQSFARSIVQKIPFEPIVKELDETLLKKLEANNE